MMICGDQLFGGMMMRGRMVEGESKEQRMSREEQRLRQHMIEQYYHYLTLLRITNNFEKRLETYERLNLNEYQGQIAVIGRIAEIEVGKETEQEYYFPLMLTNVNKSLFERELSPFGKCSFAPIVRRLVVSKATYTKKLVVAFNKVITSGKKNKEQVFIFTNMQLLFRQESEVCLGLTEESHIVQLERPFYNGVFQLMEQALAFTYSDLNLANIFPDAEKGSTFVIEEIRAKIHENIQHFVMMGALKSVHWEMMEKAVNAKEKEVLLEVTQDVYPPRYRNSGSCRVYMRFDILGEEGLHSHLKEGCVYLFQITDVILTDNVTLTLKLHNWKHNFIRLTNEPIRIRTPLDVYKGMQLTQLSHLTNPCIFRNKYKFKVVKYELKMLYAKVVCEKCSTSIFRSTSFEYLCKNQCGRVEGELRPWAIVGAMDKSCYAELNMENREVYDYFNISEEEVVRFKDEIAKEEQQEGKSGITLYFRRTKEEFNDDDPNQCMTTEKNQFLGGLVERCLVRVINKTIIGYGRINANENFSGFDEDIRHEALTSFAKQKEFYKKAKLFVNGNLRTFEGRGRLIPYIKVEQVL